MKIELLILLSLHCVISYVFAYYIKKYGIFDLKEEDV